MQETTRFLGLDVHAETIAVAIAERGGEVRSLGVIPNRPEAIRKLMKRLDGGKGVRACYEAGPCGYVLYWQLAELGIECIVVAPTLVPSKAGDKVKTDRRDAEKLARCFRAGDLTPVWVPSKEHEALRDLVRAREVAKEDQRRARQRLQKFHLRLGLVRPEKSKAWGLKHLDWIRKLSFDLRAHVFVHADFLAEVDHQTERVAALERAIDEVIATLPPEIQAVLTGLQTLRGVAKITAVTIVAELGKISRFSRPSQLMAYAGLVPREHSSGGSVRRGAITKTGNGHLRKIMTESAWSYRHRPSKRGAIGRRQVGQSDAVQAISWKAQQRLHSRYLRLVGRGKPKQTVITAIARELLGFVWSIGNEVERRVSAS